MNRPPGQVSTNRAKARALLKSWLVEDVNTSDRSMELLKTELDGNRESDRKLFPLLQLFARVDAYLTEKAKPEKNG